MLFRSLEYLETMGVPVIGFQTNEFPAFYSRSSGLSLSLSLDSTQHVAAFIHEKRKLNLAGGVLIANPIPREFEIEQSIIEPAIAQAVEEAAHKGIHGKELTPFLLKRLNEITQGQSQQANKQLVLNNAAIAASVAEIGRAHV